jgi:dolichol kinase
MNLNAFLHDIIVALPLFVYVLIIVSVVSKHLYNVMIGKGFPKNVAIYYNRKFIHITTGGLIALLLPFLFKEPYTPFAFALILALVTLYPHISKKELEWFQTKDNAYEVNFCIAWGTSILILWLALGDPWKAIVPALFISFGDAVTGVVRNAVFGKRTKHWLGNMAMACTVIPIGYMLTGIVGAIAGAIASAIERLEFGPIDDNILIALSSTTTLLLLHMTF